MVAAAHESLESVGKWMVWCHAGYSMDHATNWVQIATEGHARKTVFEFAIVADDGTFAGGCGINHINTIDRFANLGYWVRASYERRGLATKATNALIDWAFANTDLNRIEIVAAVGNRRSQRVAEKVGAVREAVLRDRMIVGGVPVDAVMFSVVRTDRHTR